MAEVKTDDISGYAEYLKSQGVSDSDIHGYTKYLADQHGVSHEGVMDSIGKGAMGAVETVGRTVDKYTGAPTRAAIGAYQEGKSPISAFSNQFGSSPDKAPTGEQISRKAGFSDERPTAMTGQQQEEWDKQFNPGVYAGQKGKYEDQKYFSENQVIGAGINFLADPTLLAGPAMEGIQALRGAAKAAKVASEGAEAASGVRQSVSATQSQIARSSGEAAAKSGVAIHGGDLTVEQSGKVFDYKAPQTLEELRQWTPPKENAGELPGKARLKQIETMVPDLETKPLKYHYDMMENPKSMKELKLTFENLPTADAKKIATYNQSIIDESGIKVQKTIEDLAGGKPKDLSDAGNDFIGTVKDKYNTEKEALGPVFQEIQNRSQNMNPVASRDLIVHLGEDTKLKKLLNQDKETGRFYLEKNAPRSGISDAEHGLLSRVVDDLNDGMTFRELQDTREFLRKAVDPKNPGAYGEVNKVRSVLLNQLESMADGIGKDVGDTFKRYAINEKNRESVEKIIGGKIESLDEIYAANPDKVVQKIFSNPNYVKIVGEYIGPEKLNELAAAFINNGIKKSFDSANGFNPVALRQWIKSNATFLKENVSPEMSNRLSALADYGYYGKRFLDEVNPSGTAASLKEMLEPKNFALKIRKDGIVGAVTSEVTSRAHAFANQRQATKTLNEALGGAKKTSSDFEFSKNAGKLASEVARPGQSAAIATRNLSTGSQISRAADENSPSKGPEKWANDGFQNLLDHAKTQKAKQDLLKSKDALMKSKKGKDLLIKASDLKPGSKAMDDLFSNVRAEEY